MPDERLENPRRPVSAVRPGPPWTSLRHRCVYAVLRPFFRVYLRLAFGFHAARFHGENPRQPYLILANHTGPFDGFMLAMSFCRPIYFVASDHIFRLGLASRLIRYLIAPIPIVKSVIDTRSIRDILTIIHEGGTVGLFPSGNRSFTGPEMPIPPSTGKLARHLEIPVLLYRIEGGYLTTPRWSRSRRLGRMTGSVVRVMMPDELAALTSGEIHRILSEVLRAAPSAGTPPPVFRGRRLAEYLERVLFVCPKCLRMDSMRSKDDLFSCPCGFAVRYLPDGSLAPATIPAEVELPALPDVDAFDRFQRAHIARLIESCKDRNPWLRKPFFSDENQLLVRTERARRARPVMRGTMRLFADRLLFESESVGRVFPLDRLGEVLVHGPQTLQFFNREDGSVYEVRSSHPRSAYRYMLIIEALKNTSPPA